MTRGRGRGRPPGSGKNQRAPMDPALRAAIAGQDEAHGEKENAYVLSMITGADEHTDYYSDEDGDDDAAFEASALTNVPEVSQNRSSTQVTQSQPSQSQPSQNNSKSNSRPAVIFLLVL